MSDIEMRARGLIAAQYKHRRVSEVRRLIDPAVPLSALDYPNQRAIKAIVAALTLPESYVLVPAEPTDDMLMADAGAIPSRASLWRAMIAARPEVSGG